MTLNRSACTDHRRAQPTWPRTRRESRKWVGWAGRGAGPGRVLARWGRGLPPGAAFAVRCLEGGLSAADRGSPPSSGGRAGPLRPSQVSVGSQVPAGSLRFRCRRPVQRASSDGEPPRVHSSLRVHTTPRLRPGARGGASRRLRGRRPAPRHGPQETLWVFK